MDRQNAALDFRVLAPGAASIQSFHAARHPNLHTPCWGVSECGNQRCVPVSLTPASGRSSSSMLPSRQVPGYQVRWPRWQHTSPGPHRSAGNIRRKSARRRFFARACWRAAKLCRKNRSIFSVSFYESKIVAAPAKAASCDPRTPPSHKMLPAPLVRSRLEQRSHSCRCIRHQT